MKFIQNSLICVLLVSLALMTGCARPPIDEMNEAEEAVSRAENDPDAVSYAGNLITRAQEALALMHEEADSKRYDSAKNYAAEAIDLAERAIDEGFTASLRARQDALAAVSGVRPLILETESRIDNAKAADLPLDFDSIDRDFDAARRSYDQAQSAVSGSRYQEAIFLCNNVRAGLNGINQKLGTSVMEVSRKK
jgi:hypothetical protein